MPAFAGMTVCAGITELANRTICAGITELANRTICAGITELANRTKLRAVKKILYFIMIVPGYRDYPCK